MTQREEDPRLSEAATIAPAAGMASSVTIPVLGMAKQTALPQIPGFHMQEELGRGGMGVVYLARQLRLNRLVAVKMIKGAEQANADTRMRFLAEAEAIAKLHHPGVVQVYEFGTYEDNPFFAMEYVSGGSLDKKLAGNPLPPREAAAFVEKLARAMQSAHDEGIIHRDLKPANILLSSETAAFGSPSKATRNKAVTSTQNETINSDHLSLHSVSPKITDFGLVKNIGSDMTATGAILGTPSYMAPEQADGKKTVGPPVDIYALGAILYECLTGRPPFKAATPLETLMQVINEEPVSVRQLQPKTPIDLETICQKCLQKEPAKRYASAADLAEDLGRFLRNEPISARPVSRLEKAWRWCKRYPAVAGLVIVLTAGLFLIAAKNRELAEANKNEAEARELAEKRFRQTLSAVDQFFTDISESPELLKKEPGTQALRRTLLSKAQAYYEMFLAERGQDETMQLEAAEASYRLIRILEELNPGGSATEEQIEKAMAIRDKLLKKDPADPDRQYAVALVEAQKSRWLLIRDRLQDAIAIDKKALDRLAPIVTAHPEEEKYKILQSSILTSLAQIYTRLGNHTDAIAMYKRAEPVTLSLYEANPKMLKFRSELGRLYSSIGYSNLQSGLLDEALPYFSKAAAIFDDLLKEFPKDRNAAVDGGVVYGNLGVIHKRAHRDDEALNAFNKVVEIYEPLLRDNPQVVDFANGLALGLGSIARLEMDRGNHNEARQPFERVLQIFDKLRKENPNVARYAENVALTYSNLSQLELIAGKFQDAFNYAANAVKIAEPIHRANPSVRSLASIMADAFRMQGRIYYMQGKLPEALETLSKSQALSLDIVKANPRLPAFAKGLADTYLLMQRVQTKLKNKTEAVNANAKAVAVLDKLVSEDPKNTGLVNSLAQALLETPDNKVEAIKRAVTLMEQVTQDEQDDDDDSSHWATLGYAYYCAGNYDKSKVALVRSQKAETSAYNSYYLAMTSGQLGNKKQALAQFEEGNKLAAKRPDDDRLLLIKEQAATLLGLVK